MIEGNGVDPIAVTLTDSSSNGTYVNGARLTKGTALTLKAGDRVHLFKPKTKKAQGQLVLFDFDLLPVPLKDNQEPNPDAWVRGRESCGDSRGGDGLFRWQVVW